MGVESWVKGAGRGYQGYLWANDKLLSNEINLLYKDLRPYIKLVLLQVSNSSSGIIPEHFLEILELDSL